MYSYTKGKSHLEWKKETLPLLSQPIAEQRHLLVTELNSRLTEENRAKNVGLFSSH